jgi:hypothetical protein
LGIKFFSSSIRGKNRKIWGKKKSCTFGLKVGLLTTASLLFLRKNGARNLLETLMTISFAGHFQPGDPFN